MSRTMHAFQYDHFGGGADALTMVDVTIPKPKKNELLVKIEASSINPVDWKTQKGTMRPFLPRKLPHIPGCDISGEVVEVGPGVEDLRPGDKVVAWLDIRIGGSLAEYALASIKFTTKIPPGVSVVDAACLPTAGMTALQAVRDFAGLKLDGSSGNFNVLITGASGGVGHYALQIVKVCGAHVTATCGTRNLDLVKTLGADEVLDYATKDGAELKSPSGRKYDAVIHCVVNIPYWKLQQNLSSTGCVVDVTPSCKTIWAYASTIFSRQKVKLMFMIPKRKDLQILVDLLKEGKMRSVVDSEHPLSKAQDAWSKSIEGHATGKVVIKHET